MTDSIFDDDAFRAARLGLLAALMDNDLYMAQRIARDLLADGHDFDHIVEDLFAPVQDELGRRWAAGDLTVADEHAASETLGELLSLLGSVVDAPTGVKVVVATPEHDAHRLGARYVAAALSLEGFHVISLGPAVPPEDLADYLAMQGPAALALSCSVTPALASAARSVAVAHDAGVPVVVGGLAVPQPERANRLGADGFAGSARDAIALLKEWVSQPPTRLGPAPAPILEHAALQMRAPAVVAAAVASAGSQAERPDRLADEMRRLLLVVESAVLLDEHTLVGEHLRWLRSLDPTHGIDPGVVDTAVEAAAQACDGELERIGRVLRDNA